MGEVLRTSFGKGEDRRGPLRFGAVTVDFDGGRVLGPWGARRIEPRATDVLRRLVEASPAVVSRERLLDDCWPGGDGSDEALTQAVAQLRRALGDKPTAPRFIETAPKRGYRWIGAGEAAEASTPGRPAGGWRRGVAALAAATAAGFAGAAIFLAVKPAPQAQLVEETVLLKRGADGRLMESRYSGPPRGQAQPRSSSPLPSGSLRYSETPSPPEP